MDMDLIVQAFHIADLIDLHPMHAARIPHLQHIQVEFRFHEEQIRRIREFHIAPAQLLHILSFLFPAAQQPDLHAYPSRISMIKKSEKEDKQREAMCT